MCTSQSREGPEKKFCATLLFLLDVVLLQDLKGVGERGRSSEGIGGVQIRQWELSDRVDGIINPNKRRLFVHTQKLVSVSVLETFDCAGH